MSRSDYDISHQTWNYDRPAPTLRWPRGAECRRCGEPKAMHVEVRWQGPPGCVDMALVCPREGLKAGALPADFFLPLLDDMEYQP